MIVPLSYPDISDTDTQAVMRVLQTPDLSLGPKMTEFEQKFAAYIGTKYAVAVNSGTSGLHLAVKSLDIGANDAVLTTSFSFIASANCILYEKALPLFVDIEPDTLNIDCSKLADFLKRQCRICPKTGRPIHRQSGRTIKAILPVHVFGYPCRMSAIMALAEAYRLWVIEDACEAIGAEMNGQMVGSIGHAGIFAFYPNKQITTGEGGMIVTSNRKIANLCKSLRNQGRDLDDGWLNHRRLGFNYRLGEMSCALGIAQLERIETILTQRARVADTYNKLLDGVVLTPKANGAATRSWFVYVICLPESFTREARDDILEALVRAGIGCNNYFPPIHLQPIYRHWSKYQDIDLPVTESISVRTIALPFFTKLQQKEVKHVVATLKGILNGQPEARCD